MTVVDAHKFLYKQSICKQSNYCNIAFDLNLSGKQVDVRQAADFAWPRDVCPTRPSDQGRLYRRPALVLPLPVSSHSH